MLVLALDLMDAEKALEIAERVSEHVSAVKVNYPLVLSAGIEIISALSEIRPVIADFKIADIPYTSGLIAEIAFRSGASAVIAHGFVGRDVLLRLREVAGEFGGEVYVVTELSSRGGKEFMSRHALEIVKLAAETGCDGLIAPGTRPERVREIRDAAGDMRILCPGVGAQGGVAAEVVRAGADGVIVGRSIYLAENPEEVARSIRTEIESAAREMRGERKS
ncbi:orotidine-5'-phosphate decarboxylase [Geoglobus sp.]